MSYQQTLRFFQIYCRRSTAPEKRRVDRQVCANVLVYAKPNQRPELVWRQIEVQGRHTSSFDAPFVLIKLFDRGTPSRNLRLHFLLAIEG